jgi:hypothetical protein
MLRDTLEYMHPERKEFNIAQYNQRKNVLSGMLNNPSPLRHFFDQNKEAGEKIGGKLQEFIDDVYGENSTILHIHDDKITVDAAQHIAVYDYVVGLHEHLTDILQGYINYAKNQNASSEEFEELILDDERLYRSIIYLTVFEDIIKTFVEFNQAMRENNGQPSPQSNFIINDLRKYIGYIKFSAQHSRVKDQEYTKLVDDVEKVFAHMEGKEPLPEGKTFNDVFEATKLYIRSLVAAYETKWKTSFNTILTQVIEFEKKARAN